MSCICILIGYLMPLQTFYQYAKDGLTSTWRYPEKQYSPTEKKEITNKAINGISENEEREKKFVHQFEKERIATRALNSLSDESRETKINDDLHKSKLDVDSKECPNCYVRYDRKKIKCPTCGVYYQKIFE